MLQCSKCQPGRKLVGQCRAAEHLPQRLPNFRPKTSYASINHSAISVVLPVSSDCWLLYLSIIKLLQPENFQQQKKKLSVKINIIEVNV